MGCKREQVLKQPTKSKSDNLKPRGRLTSGRYKGNRGPLCPSCGLTVDSWEGDASFYLCLNLIDWTLGLSQNYSQCIITMMIGLTEPPPTQNDSLCDSLSCRLSLRGPPGKSKKISSSTFIIYQSLSTAPFEALQVNFTKRWSLIRIQFKWHWPISSLSFKILWLILDDDFSSNLSSSLFFFQLPAGLTAAACPNYPYCDAT